MPDFHLAVCMFVSSVVVIAIVLIRKIFQNQLSSKWQYNLWFLLLTALTLPFLPAHIVHVGASFVWHQNQTNNPSPPHSSPENPLMENGRTWTHDFSISVNRFDVTWLSQILTIVWVAGILVMVGLNLHAWLKLRQVKKSARVMTDQQILAVFETCKQRLRVSQKPVLADSPLVKSPMTFGIFKTYAILPRGAEAWLSEEELTYIFLHELHHVKYKDIVTNYLIVLFQMLYWYNPLIWMAFRKMRLDREVACDHAVLKTLAPDDYAAYGNTIIKFARKSSFSASRFAMVNQLASSKQHLKKRIERIAAFSTESRRLTLKSMAIFSLLAALVVCQIPVVSAMSYGEDRIHFENNQTTYEDLKVFFNGYEGSFVLYDLQKAQYHIYNKEKSVLRVSPNSTYKIYDALFALDAGVITPGQTSLKWDGSTYPYKAWNQNQNLHTAMENSVSWYFQELDKKIQRRPIQAYLQKIQYGNQNLSGGMESYWLESSLKISPVEQVQTLKNFYTNQLMFKEKHVQLVKESIKLETKDHAALYGKTGTGTVNGKDVNGWFIGYVETENNTYFFATNIESNKHANGSTAAGITKSILKDKNLY